MNTSQSRERDFGNSVKTQNDCFEQEKRQKITEEMQKHNLGRCEILDKIRRFLCNM